MSWNEQVEVLYIQKEAVHASYYFHKQESQQGKSLMA